MRGLAVRSRGTTHELHGAVPGGGHEEVLLEVGPVEGEDLARVLLPRAEGQILEVLAGRSTSARGGSCCGAYVEHDVPQPDRAVARGGDELVLVDLGPRDVVEPVLRVVATAVKARI